MRNIKNIKEITEGCAVFFDKVMQHFRYLADDYGFRVVREEDPRVFDNCLVVLCSNQCCIRVVRDRGDVLLEVGPTSAVSMESSDNLWFYVTYVVAFLTQEGLAEVRNLLYEAPDEYLESERRADWQLPMLADRLRPYWDDIFALFREDGFSERRRALVEFVRKPPR